MLKFRSKTPDTISSLEPNSSRKRTAAFLAGLAISAGIGLSTTPEKPIAASGITNLETVQDQHGPEARTEYAINSYLNEKFRNKDYLDYRKGKFRHLGNPSDKMDDFTIYNPLFFEVKSDGSSKIEKMPLHPGVYFGYVGRSVEGPEVSVIYFDPKTMSFEGSSETDIAVVEPNGNYNLGMDKQGHYLNDPSLTPKQQKDLLSLGFGETLLVGTIEYPTTK